MNSRHEMRDLGLVIDARTLEGLRQVVDVVTRTPAPEGAYAAAGAVLWIDRLGRLAGRQIAGGAVVVCLLKDPP